MMKMKKQIIYIAIVTIVVSCTQKQEETTGNISVPVSVTEIKAKKIEKYINTTGTVNPTKEVELKSQTNGHYLLQNNPNTGKKYKMGDIVQKNEIIIKIEDKEFKNGIKIEAQKLNLEISKQTYNKQKSLYEKGGVTLNDLKKAEIDFINAKYSYEDANIKLEKMLVRAQFTGVIVDLPYFTEKTKIATGTNLVKIMDYKTLIMDIKLPEKDINQVRQKNKVRITNYTLPNDTLWGRITQLSPAINQETRTFKGRIIIDNPNSMLRPGMFVNANITVSKKENTIVISKDYIMAREHGRVAFIVEKGIARECMLTFGLENPKEVEILSGIQLNDKLVTKGFETLHNRSKVKIIR